MGWDAVWAVEECLPEGGKPGTRSAVHGLPFNGVSKTNIRTTFLEMKCAFTGGGTNERSKF